MMSLFFRSPNNGTTIVNNSDEKGLPAMIAGRKLAFFLPTKANFFGRSRIGDLGRGLVERRKDVLLLNYILYF